MSSVTATTTAPDPTGSAGVPASSRPRLDWRLRFAALSLIWGFSFLLIKVGTQGYALPGHPGTPGVRHGRAGGRDGGPAGGLPRGARTWMHLAVAGFLLNALPFSLFAFAELTIPSTLAASATRPPRCGAWRCPWWRCARTGRPGCGWYLGLGFLGVLTVLGAWQGFHGLDARGTTLALLASLSYPVGWIYVRRTLAGSSASHLSLTGGQLLLATVQLAVVTPLFTSAPSSLALGPLLAIAALGTLGTGLAVLIQYGIVAEVGPTTGQMVTYFVPVIAAAGILLLGETLTWSTPVGAAVVLAGAALTQVKPKRRGDGGGHPGSRARLTRTSAGPLPGRTAAAIASASGSISASVRVETVTRMPGVCSSGSALRGHRPAGVQEAGDRARLVGYRHPQVHAAAPVRLDRAPAQRRGQRVPALAVARRDGRRVHRAVGPQPRHRALEGQADPAGPEALPAAYPVEGERVAGEDSEAQVGTVRLGGRAGEGPAVGDTREGCSGRSTMW